VNYKPASINARRLLRKRKFVSDLSGLLKSAEVPKVFVSFYYFL
jgi:hypothetical protein